jgi:hypothetical protein
MQSAWFDDYKRPGALPANGKHLRLIRIERLQRLFKILDGINRFLVDGFNDITGAKLPRVLPDLGHDDTMNVRRDTQ